MTHAQEATRYYALRDKMRYLARYGAFLMGCMREAARGHTAQEVEAAAERLEKDSRP